jgi:hypothetical protein
MQMPRVLAAVVLALLAAGVRPDAQAARDSFSTATAHMRAGRFGDALPLLEGFLRANPNHLAARNNLAVCLIKLSRFAEAEAHLQRVLAAAPQRSGAHLNLGVARHGLERARAGRGPAPLAAARGHGAILAATDRRRSRRCRHGRRPRAAARPARAPARRVAAGHRPVRLDRARRPAAHERDGPIGRSHGSSASAATIMSRTAFRLRAGPRRIGSTPVRAPSPWCCGMGIGSDSTCTSSSSRWDRGGPDRRAAGRSPTNGPGCDPGGARMWEPAPCPTKNRRGSSPNRARGIRQSARPSCVLPVARPGARSA